MTLTLEERKRMIREIAIQTAERICSALDQENSRDTIILVGPYFAIASMALNLKFEGSLWEQQSAQQKN